MIFSPRSLWTPEKNESRLLRLLETGVDSDDRDELRQSGGVPFESIAETQIQMDDGKDEEFQRDVDEQTEDTSERGIHSENDVPSFHLCQNKDVCSSK